jgi:type III pantothenate kinase
MAQPLLALCVGNTRTRYGLFDGQELRASGPLDNDLPGVIESLRSVLGEHHGVPTAVSSVNPAFCERLLAEVEELTGEEALLFGRDLQAPMRHTLDDASTLGQDRVLCAFGAYSRSKQACIVVDAGTAITVDFVDGEGTFHGGAIAPGVSMMLRALHEQTAVLPSVAYAPPDATRGPLGKETSHAMLLGVHEAAIGLVHRLIDRYAEYYGGYPRVVATGGDAAALFGEDTLVEQIVPDLQLVGICEAVRALAAAEEEGSGEGDA